LIELISFKKSTHKIEYRPIEVPGLEDEIDFNSPLASNEERALNQKIAEELGIEGL
jgi:hypothetical protein